MRIKNGVYISMHPKDSKNGQAQPIHFWCWALLKGFIVLFHVIIE